MALYDAFISYSHAKDKPIASALQSVIQRLGKPWYRRRALRLFRDDTSLSATPHLWPTIEKALSESRFLLVLASPEAAASQWVNKEVAWWLEHKGIDTLLIAVVDGELAWDTAHSDFAWGEGTPLPAVLTGRFPSEPKWVDLRAYRHGADAHNAEFTSLAADFAAAIHGLPKEDLLSQEVRQQRRALTLAWSAVGTLVLLISFAAWQWWEADTAKKAAQTAARIATEQKEVAQAQRDRAERTLTAATGTANSLVNDLARKFRDRTGIPLSLVRDILDRARDLQQQLTASGETAPHVRRSEAMALAQVAYTLLDQGDASAALAEAERERQIMAELVALNPSDTEWQRAWAFAYRVIGDALQVLGRQPHALEAYQTANEILTKLVTLDSTQALWQNERAASFSRIGNTLLKLGRSEQALAAFRQAVAISEQVVEADPANVEWQYGLATNCDWLGRGLDAAGQLKDALAELERALAIRQRLAAGDPQNGDYQNEVSRSLIALADVHRHGSREQAIATLQKALAVIEPIANRDPGNGVWQNNLSTVHQRLGDLFVQAGNRDKALEHFQHDLAIRERLATANPERSEWQQFLANAYNRIGDMRLPEKQYDEALGWYRKALAIRERLAASVPANADWQGMLAGEHVLVARALVQQGKQEEGVASYQRAIAIFQRLTELDPGNVPWEQMLTIAVAAMAEVLAKIEGRLPEAIDALQRSIAIQIKLVAAQPSFVPRRWNLAVTYVNLGDFLLAAKQREEALAGFRQSTDILEKLAVEEIDNPRSKGLLSYTYAMIGDLLAELGRRAEAIAFYRKCAAVREALAAAAPDETYWQIYLVRALVRLAEWGDEAEPRYTRALQIMESLQAAGKLPPDQKDWIAITRRKLSAIHAKAARAALYLGDTTAALREMLLAVKMAPSDHYHVLWLHMIRARKGIDDGEELAANAAGLDTTTWPWPIVALFIGKETPERVRAAALSAKDEKIRREQTCEADFYLGVFHLEKSAIPQARPLLASAAEKCPPDFIESEGAGQELKRLELAAAPPVQR